EVQIGAPHFPGQAAVLVFGVDDRHLHTGLQGAQALEGCISRSNLDLSSISAIGQEGGCPVPWPRRAAASSEARQARSGTRRRSFKGSGRVGVAQCPGSEPEGDAKVLGPGLGVGREVEPRVALVWAPPGLGELSELLVGDAGTVEVELTEHLPN